MGVIFNNKGFYYENRVDIIIIVNRSYFNDSVLNLIYFTKLPSNLVKCQYNMHMIWLSLFLI